MNHFTTVSAKRKHNSYLVWALAVRVGIFCEHFILQSGIFGNRTRARSGAGKLYRREGALGIKSSGCGRGDRGASESEQRAGRKAGGRPEVRPTRIGRVVHCAVGGIGFDFNNRRLLTPFEFWRPPCALVLASPMAGHNFGSIAEPCRWTFSWGSPGASRYVGGRGPASESPALIPVYQGGPRKELRARERRGR
jgi:hypothetical protein